MCLVVGQIWILIATGYPEELPLTRNVPIDQFQNRQEDVKPYNFDAPPQGMFRTIEMAEGFEEEVGFRRQNEIVPVNPTSEFHSSDKPVFIVFQLYQHFQSFEIFGVCYPEEVLKLRDAFEHGILPRFAPVTILALLITLVLIFAFQAENITGKAFHVLLIAIPILLQVYFNSSLAYGLMKFLKVPHAVAAPGALIGASNFFELAVATAIALFGPGSGAALATVVGVLVEVPVMLSVCAVCNRTRHWFPAESRS